jgi:arabinofuranosyltransferase
MALEKTLAPYTVAAAPDVGRSDAIQLARAALFLLFTYVFLANAWLGDDAYITFRVVWNFVRGYGPVFNPDERVQAFTHPLWMFVLSAAHVVTREFFFTVTALSWALGVALIAVLVRWAGSLPRAAVIVAWLVTSKAFVDYTSSGLEYPLSYLLLALFYVRYLSRPIDVPPGPRELGWFVLIASLGFLNRPDAILLYIVPTAEMAVRSLRRYGALLLPSVAIGAAPAVLWVVFATLYYGFPLPNTYYAKVANGIPRFLMLGQGVAYVLNSIRHDPITLGTIALAALYSWRTPGPARLAAASAALYVVYTISVGGDFMSGRFFAKPFLVAVMTMAPEIRSLSATWAAAALVLYNVLVPLVPVKTTASYDGAWPWRTQNGIKDERGHYHRATNLLFFSPFRELPELTFVREGISFGSSPARVAVHGSVGMFGLYAGPEKFVVDRNALTDPLLARVPVSPRLYFEFYASHYFRDIPDGYLESCERDQNLLTDPVLRPYYDRLRNVTRGSLFSASRLRDIWALNFGSERDLHQRFERRRPVVLSIRADNERFLSDVGHRDPIKGTLTASRRAGYLQYGPHIPMKPGHYRARWIGVVNRVPGESAGFVEIWSGGERIEHAPVASGAAAHGVIAQADFQLTDGTDDLEYRLYVHADVDLTIERVELYSSFAAPADH